MPKRSKEDSISASSSKTKKSNAPEKAPAPTKEQPLNSRRRSLAAPSSSSNIPKRSKWSVSISHDRGSGTLFCFGSNETGQLGLDLNEVNKRKFPALVTGVQKLKFTQVVCGAMHTVALTNDGKVYTFGCNDDGALGRLTESEEQAATPSQVQFKEKIAQISAGDSHSAALTQSGKLYVWGSFRNQSGDIGLIPGEGRVRSPRLFKFSLTEEFEPTITKVASGSNHVAALATDGSLYTFGDGELGQLGRYISTRHLRHNNSIPRADKFLRPQKVEHSSLKNICDISAGMTSTFCTTDKGEIWAFGLNCNSQLGITAKHHSQEGNILYIPRRVQSFTEGKPWTQIEGGEYHTVALNEKGQVFGVGQSLDGRLGIGEDITNDQHTPTHITGPLGDRKCVQVACGGSTSYAVTDSGELYAWGFGENWQLGNGEEDDAFVPTRCKSARNDEGINGKVIGVSAGSQHVAALIQLPVSGSLVTKDMKG